MASSKSHSKKGHEFLCHVKFRNNLPDLPVDSKYLSVEPNLEAFVPYSGATSIERDYKYDIAADLLRSSLLDFVNVDLFKERLSDKDDGDIFLANLADLERQASSTANTTPKGASAKGPGKVDVAWLRRTEYISSECGSRGGAHGKGAIDQSANVFLPNTIDRLKETIETIEASFKEPIPLETLSHPRNPNLKPIRSIPIFPDPKYAESVSLCSFDSDPSVSAAQDQTFIRNPDEHAVIKAMTNAEKKGDTFIWYYLPLKKPASSSVSPTDPQEYSFVREYDIQRVDRSAQYFILTIDDAKSCYRPIDSSFMLKKRRAKSTIQGTKTLRL